MAYPDYQQYQQDAKAFRVIPVFATIAADLETPMTHPSHILTVLEKPNRGIIIKCIN
jgi:hypothetical protein